MSRTGAKGIKAACHPERAHYALGMCHACWQKDYFERNPEQRKKRNKSAGARYRKNRDKWNDRSREKLYGVTREQFDKENEKQGGRCAICRALPRPGHRLHIDHNHATGEFRGLLCWKCNVAIGIFEDNPELLGKAIEYVTHDGRVPDEFDLLAMSERVM